MQQTAAFVKWARVARDSKAKKQTLQQVMQAMTGPESRLTLLTIISSWAKAVMDCRLRRAHDAVHRTLQQQGAARLKSAELMIEGDSKMMRSAAFAQWAKLAKGCKAKRMKMQQVTHAMIRSSCRLALANILGAWAKAALNAWLERANDAVNRTLQQQAALRQSAAARMAEGNPRMQQAAAFTKWAQISKESKAKLARLQHVLVAMAGCSSRLALSSSFNAWGKAVSYFKFQRSDDALQRTLHQQAAARSKAAALMAEGSPRMQQAAAFVRWAHVAKACKSQQEKMRRVTQAMAGSSGRLALSNMFSAWATSVLHSRLRRSSDRAAVQTKVAFYMADAKMKQATAFLRWAQLAESSAARGRSTQRLLLAFSSSSIMLTFGSTFGAWAKTVLDSRLRRTQEEQAAVRSKAERRAAYHRAKLKDLAAAVAGADASMRERVSLSCAMAAWLHACQEAWAASNRQQADRSRCLLSHMQAAALGALARKAQLASKAAPFRAWAASLALARKTRSLRRFDYAVDLLCSLDLRRRYLVSTMRAWTQAWQNRRLKIALITSTQSVEAEAEELLAEQQQFTKLRLLGAASYAARSNARAQLRRVLAAWARLLSREALRSAHDVLSHERQVFQRHSEWSALRHIVYSWRILVLYKLALKKPAIQHAPMPVSVQPLVARAMSPTLTPAPLPAAPPAQCSYQSTRRQTWRVAVEPLQSSVQVAAPVAGAPTAAGARSWCRPLEAVQAQRSGRLLAAEEPVSLIQYQLAPPTKLLRTRDEARRCFQCSNVLMPDAKFCRKCGTHVGGTDVEAIKCLHCCNVLMPDANFCRKCGKKVEEEVPASEPQTAGAAAAFESLAAWQKAQMQGSTSSTAAPPPRSPPRSRSETAFPNWAFFDP